MLKSDVGFSGHGTGITELSEHALGAKIIEKHVTLNKKMFGPDHAASLEFDTFKELVDLCRKVSISLGSDKKSSLNLKKFHGILIRKFIVRTNIKKGQNLHLTILKPRLLTKKVEYYLKIILKFLEKRQG